MHFKIYEVPRTPDSTVEKQVVFKTDDQDEAIAKFDRTLSGKIRDRNCNRMC